MSDLSVIDLFHKNEIIKVCAPMVRYSKLAFRTLVRTYDCDLCFTPMIMADSFVVSHDARINEFSTSTGDRPLVVQFAAKNCADFISAAEMVAPYSQGVDLNCGCPQRWAMQDGYGASLLRNPHLIQDMVFQVRNRIPHPFTVSVKIRLSENLRSSVEMCKNLEAAGVSFLTVHARTPAQRCQPINEDALTLINQNVSVPVIANGDVRTLADAHYLHGKTGCKGIMAARGLLSNPAMFAGYSETPLICLQDWVTLTKLMEVPFICFHHHVVFMTEKLLSKNRRNALNQLKTQDAVLQFLEEHLQVSPDAYSPKFGSHSRIRCDYPSVLNKMANKTEQIENEGIVHESFLGDSIIFDNVYH